jgi:RNA-binding protein
MDKKILRQMGHSLQPLVRIGKNGMNDAIVAEIVKQLKKHKLVKVKLLQSFDCNRKEVARKLAVDTSSVLVSVVGGVVVLWRK